jgi:NitT/TauT family transport system permease protein
MRTRAGRFFSGIGWPCGISLSALLIWEAAVRELHIRSIILPPPSEILVVMFERRDLLLMNLWSSLYLTVLGFSLSVAGGVLLAVVITYSSIARQGFYPIVIVSQIVPKIAIAPLFIAWFGTGMTSSLLLAVLITFFPMTINAALGFQSIDEDTHRMARAFTASDWDIFWKIRMPNGLPYIFSGMKISITLAVIGVVVSEFVGSQEGIGYLIKLAGGLLDTPLMMAAIAVLSISGLAIYGLIALAEHHLIYWQTSDDTGGISRS